MTLPANPVSGGHTLDNPHRDDLWTCPNCYEDHEGWGLSDSTIDCSCGARLKLTVEQQPVCRAECVDPELLDEAD